VTFIIIIIMSHLLHKNKSQVLIIQMVDMQMEQAKSYKLIQGLACAKSRVSIYIVYIISACQHVQHSDNRILGYTPQSEKYHCRTTLSEQ